MHMPFQPLLNHHQCYLSEYRSENLPQGFFVNWDALAKLKASYNTHFYIFHKL